MSRGRARTLPARVVRHVADIAGSGVRPGDRVVALTFDDGPSADFTPALLDILAQYRVPATFFMVGREAASQPDLVRTVASSGHAIGCHTWDHARLVGLGEEEFARQVDRANDLLRELTGQAIRCLRPPYRSVDADVVKRVCARAATVVLWSLDPRDWSRPGTNEIVQRVLDGLHPGAIISLHDGGPDRSQTVAALPAILDGISARGYRPVTL